MPSAMHALVESQGIEVALVPHFIVNVAESDLPYLLLELSPEAAGNGNARLIERLPRGKHSLKVVVRSAAFVQRERAVEYQSDSDMSEWRSGGAAERRSPGAVESWSGGVLERWSPGAVESWSGGVLERWSPGAVESWSSGVLEW